MVDHANGGGQIVSYTEHVEKGMSAEASMEQEICMAMHVLLLANPNVILIANAPVTHLVMESKLSD